LGLQKEDESEKNEMEDDGEGHSAWNECDDNDAAIPIFQQLLRERQFYDRNTPMMEPRSVYPSMKNFRVAMRQYAIDKEFQLSIEARDKTRYSGYCHGVESVHIV
jgi:hypothetical protein